MGFLGFPKSEMLRLMVVLKKDIDFQPIEEESLTFNYESFQCKSKVESVNHTMIYLILNGIFFLFF